VLAEELLAACWAIRVQLSCRSCMSATTARCWSVESGRGELSGRPGASGDAADATEGGGPTGVRAKARGEGFEGEVACGDWAACERCAYV